MNLYTYCHNDPINFIDPTGHMAADVTVEGVKVGNTKTENGVTTGNLTDVIKGLGGSVDWDGTTRTATVNLNGQKITYDLDDMENGKGKASDGSEFYASNGKIQIGIREVSEKAGAKIDYHVESGTNKVSASYDHASGSEDTEVEKVNGKSGAVLTTDNM